MLYSSPYGGLWFIKLKFDHGPYWRTLWSAGPWHTAWTWRASSGPIWGPTATHAKGLISSRMPCHNPDADHLPYDPDLARQQLSSRRYGSGPDLSLLMIDLHRPHMVAMGVAMKEYWKDNLDVELDILKRESGVQRREEAQLYRISIGSWIPDPIQIVNIAVRRDDIGYTPPRVLDTVAEHVRSLPLDDPERCAVVQAFEEEYFDKVYAIPIREFDPVRWVVQPWLRGFRSTVNQDFNTLTTAYVARH